MEITAVKNTIESGNAVLGIEFGSTRIKAVLIDENHNPIAQGGHSWENRFENGVWTYHMEDVWAGLQDAYSKLKSDVFETGAIFGPYKFNRSISLFNFMK